MRTRILSYGCTSGAAESVDGFWDKLSQGVNSSRSIPTQTWINPPSAQPRGYLWTPSVSSTREILLQRLLQAWAETRSRLSEKMTIKGDRVGVILASTKGFIDDFIWHCNEQEAKSESDPLTPLLHDFLKVSELAPKRSIVVSNACASSLSAMWLAERWFESGDLDHVLILAADRVGPFVVQGFGCLHALSDSSVRPFSADRNGLLLGEAAAALLLSKTESPHSPDTGTSNTEALYLDGAGLHSEGFAVTRPSESGDSLKNACLQIPRLREERRPQLVIAHGTATRLNDATEDHVLHSLFGEQSGQDTPPITATKWCIGHTLGSSGAMDVIAACEAIRRQSAFSIASTAEMDPTFKGRYLTAGSGRTDFPIQRVLVTSLGFGGVHAAVLVSGSSR